MRDLKKRMQATQKTQQITKAMHMVSAAKLKKAERAIVAFRPLTKKLKVVLSRVLSSDRDLGHPILSGRETHQTVYILVSSDRGLAGAFNNRLFKAFEAHIEQAHDSKDEFLVAALGYKAHRFAQRRKYRLLHRDVIPMRDDVQFVDFQSITDTFLTGYISGAYDKIDVFYNHFINTLNQEIKHRTLVPLEDSQFLEAEDDDAPYNRLYYYEPNARQVLYQLLPMYVEHLLYGMILESKASEHASRMTAMQNATDNAEEVINELNLKYNRARQDAITRELTDIIGGAEAVK